jgi:hypothetical protein
MDFFMKQTIISGLIISSISLFVSSTALAEGFSGNIGIEGRYFSSDPAHTGQADNSYSISLQPEYRKRWDNGRKKFTFVPFYRWDSEDDERTHGDIRELDFVMAQGDWEFQAGISKVFWGVTESQHLVDIINQTDLVEGLDGEEKLGQPMLRVSRLLENGSIDAYVLPYFRERTFPGESGRFRTALPVDTDNATYESDDEEKHVDYAVRWNQSVGNVDFGLSWFEGTSRDPEFNVATKNGKTVLQPHYPLIRQAGLDLQYTGDAWLWKLESIHRDTNDGSYNASVGGFEYTIPGIADSSADLGLLAEYHHDSRGKDATTPFQKDLFLGTRLAMNDVQSTELLAGAFIDLDDQARSFRVEASRRLGDDMKLNLEAQMISDTDVNEPFHSIRDDDYVQLEWQKFF